MKKFRKIITLILALAMLMSLSACGDRNTIAAKANTTYTGTVSVVSAKFITLSTESGNVTVEITDDTVFSREMGGMGSAMPGGMNGTVPDMPSDEVNEQGGTPPDMPTGGQGDINGQGGTPPDMPSGEVGGMNGTPPEMPGGEMNQNGQSENPPDKPDGESDSDELVLIPTENMGQMTIADISVGDTVTVKTDSEGKAASVTEGMNMGGAASGVDSYAADTEFTKDASESGTEYTSTGADENAIHVYSDAKVSLYDALISRSSDNSTGGDNSSFYGVGAAALVTDGVLTIEESTITTNAAGGAGVFAYGDGVAYVADTTIITEQDTSGGIHVAGGGTLYAWNLNVETDGESSAAIRSDRGSGTMVVNGGNYISNGAGSPAVYSTANITVNNATLTANGSEAICIEGLNTIRLFDCDLSGNMADNSQNDCTWNVILYQSMSGDSEVGNSTFEMIGGSLTAKNGGMFYTTNTESTFILSDVDITCGQDSEFFLKCTGNANQRGWGSNGKNGADCHFTAIAQKMEGNVIWDSISELDFYILDGSSLKGAILQNEANAGNGGNGYCAVYIDADSKWIVTGNSTVTRLYSKGEIVDSDGNTVSVKSSDGTVYVKGSSKYTVTVEEYKNTVDTSGASSAESFNDFKVDRA